jgi:hypothetical protein
LANPGIIVSRAVRRERADEQRTDELALLLVERHNQVADERAIRMVFEEAVGDGPKAVVRAGTRFFHRVGGAGIVEPRQQDERAVTNEAIGVLAHGLQQRRHGLRGDGPPDGARGRGARVVIEVAKLVDGRFQLFGGNGLWRRRLLHALPIDDRRDAQQSEETDDRQRVSAP